MNGFTEVLTWILCSKKENFEMLNRKDDKSTAVIIGNPRSSDFEVCILDCLRMSGSFHCSVSILKIFSQVFLKYHACLCLRQIYF